MKYDENVNPVEDPICRSAANSTPPPNTAFRSGAKTIPPLIYAAVFGIGLLVQHFLPVARVALTGTIVRFVGTLFMSASAILAGWSLASFWHARTSPLPIQPSRALVTTGPYRFIRNPMYASLACLHAGLAIWLDVFWALLFLPVVLVLVQHLVIAGEERYLEQKFGDEYRRYKARVPRWIPRFRQGNRSG